MLVVVVLLVVKVNLMEVQVQMVQRVLVVEDNHSLMILVGLFLCQLLMVQPILAVVEAVVLEIITAVMVVLVL